MRGDFGATLAALRAYRRLGAQQRTAAAAKADVSSSTAPKAPVRRSVVAMGQAIALVRCKRAVRLLALERGDRRLELDDLALEYVRLPLQILDADALRRDLAELAEPENGVLDLGDRDAQHERYRCGGHPDGSGDVLQPGPATRIRDAQDDPRSLDSSWCRIA